MIPSIETIVEDLAAGRITKSQAVTWLHANSEGAANELRDHFAAAALPPLLAYWLQQESDQSPLCTAAEEAYATADVMLKARALS